MSDAQRQTIDEALGEEARPLVLSRLEKVLTISLVGLILSAVSDLRFAPDIPWDLIILKLAGGVAQGSCAIILHIMRGSSWRSSMIMATISWIVACGAVSLNGYYMHDPLMPALLLPVMVIGAAMDIATGSGDGTGGSAVGGSSSGSSPGIGGSRSPAPAPVRHCRQVQVGSFSTAHGKGAITPSGATTTVCD